MDYDDEKARQRALSSKYKHKTGYTDNHTAEEDILWLMDRYSEVSSRLFKALTVITELKKKEMIDCPNCEGTGGYHSTYPCNGCGGRGIILKMKGNNEWSCECGKDNEGFRKTCSICYQPRELSEIVKQESE